MNKRDRLHEMLRKYDEAKSRVEDLLKDIPQGKQVIKANALYRDVLPRARKYLRELLQDTYSVQNLQQHLMEIGSTVIASLYGSDVFKVFEDLKLPPTV